MVPATRRVSTEGGAGFAPTSGEVAASPGPLVAVESIAKRFGAVQALRGVDLEVFRGEVHGLVGANGAGKSTLIRVLAGVVTPDAGTILLSGERVQISDPHH